MNSDMERVRAFLEHLILAGNDRAADRAYEYALALQTDRQRVGAYVPASMMYQAALFVKEAMPLAYKEVERLAKEQE